MAAGGWALRQQTGGAGEDTLSTIDNLTGSAFADTLVGDAEDNLLDGRGGDDTLEGGAGNDTLEGGDGSDTITYRYDPAGIDIDLGARTGTDGYGDADSFA